MQWLLQMFGYIMYEQCFFYSCSQFLDNVVAIWDIRRPFIPFASFSEHTDDVTGEGTSCPWVCTCTHVLTQTTDERLKAISMFIAYDVLHSCEIWK